jgi:Asp/Glu/hydantoin racemase
MTLALQPAIDALHLPVDVSYFTCPTPGISSINSPADSAESAKLCLPHLLPLLPHYDAFLIACYSHHPLVPQLKAECTALATASTSEDGGVGARKYVTGIFEASVLASLSLLSEVETFGIVSTGKVWEDALTEAVRAFLGVNSVSRYSGTETTGLNATELHDLPAEQVQAKMKEATKRLLKRGNVNAICLGCAGMVGLDEAVRTACIEALGQGAGQKVHIIDGVKAGVAQLLGNAMTAF